MRFLIQRVKSAEVKVNNNKISSINNGLLVFIGIIDSDTLENADYLINKLVNLRIFSDENKKMNLSIKDINGEIMLVSQFTLYADCKSGNRPSFTKAGNFDFAKELYEYIIKKCKNIISTKQGIFGEDMKISLENDGPVTIMLEKNY